MSSSALSSSSSLSKLQGLLHFWEQTDLPSVQSRLDTMATSMASWSDNSDMSELISAMKSFKADQPESVRVAAAPLVKLFQREVDAANRRARTSERAFFDAYKIVAEAADPVPILQHALQALKHLHKVDEMEVENNEMKSRLQSYEREASEYRQKDRKLQELQTKLEAYDRNIDATLETKLKEAQTKLLEEYNERLASVEEEKRHAINKHDEMAQRMIEKNEEVERLHEQFLKYESAKASMESERTEQQELLMADVERSQDIITERERELELMRDTVSDLRTALTDMENKFTEESHASNKDDDELDSVKRELKIKERELQHFIGESQKQKDELEETQTSLKQECELLKDRLITIEKEYDGLKLQLETQSDYESIKKDLSILQSLEFPSESSQGGNEVDNDERPLEVKILARSKALQNENTALRMEKEHYFAQSKTLAQELETSAAENVKQKSLIAELEGHLSKLQSLSSSSPMIRRGEAEGRSSADILLDAWETSESEGDGLLGNTSIFDKNSSAVNMLTIVQAQRERYCRRAEELEELSTQQTHQMNLLQSENETLKGDNVKLYEKIRFLQGYNTNRRQQQVIEMDDATSSKYRPQYERTLDPFNSFSSQERLKRVTQLSVLEKMILFIVKFVIANKWARMVAFGYFLFMHLLIFLVLMRLVYSDALQRDLAADWHHRFMQHMQDEHDGLTVGST